ncbi:MAG: hypothetical protein KAZ87_12000 [Spirochaetes bacterium]|nr:hypothetical protein [Spirochaetota bacterium]
MLTEKIRDFLNSRSSAGISEISNEIGEDEGAVEMALNILTDKNIVIRTLFNCSSCTSNCSSKSKCTVLFSINRDIKNN